MGSRFEQKVDLFLLFFLSVRGGGGSAEACSPDFVFNPSCVVRTVYKRFQANFRLHLNNTNICNISCGISYFGHVCPK